MPGLFDGTPLERPVTCERCQQPLAQCPCPRNAAGQITLPKDQPVRVRREKRGGKIVTVITGLDPTATDLPALLKQFRTALGTGGTIKGGTGGTVKDGTGGTIKDETGGAIKNAAIEIQGDHREKLIEILRTLGYPAKQSGG